jgi:hypothetical protein
VHGHARVAFIGDDHVAHKGFDSAGNVLGAHGHDGFLDDGHAMERYCGTIKWDLLAFG